MTDTPPKPKRRRWRWLVVGLLLFVVSVTGWWYWPRGDVRFVGSWRGYLGVVDPRTEVAIYHMRRNGSLHVESLKGFAAEMKTWHTEGDLLILGSSISPELEFAVPYITPVARLLSLSLDNEERWCISSAAHDEIVLRFPDTPLDAEGKLILRRLPE